MARTDSSTVFPGGLSTVECDDLCLHVIGEDEQQADEKQELLVTSTLASALHANGVSWRIMLSTSPVVSGYRVEENHPGSKLTATISLGLCLFILYLRACGDVVRPPSLAVAGRRRSYGDADTETMLEQHLDEIRMELAVWVPASCAETAREETFFSIVSARDTSGLRGAEAAAYTGHRMELAGLLKPSVLTG